MKIKRIHDSAEGKVQVFEKGCLILIRSEMNPVIIIPSYITAIMNIGIRRKTDQSIGAYSMPFLVQFDPRILFDKQDKIVGESRIVFNVTRIWMMRIMTAVVYDYHRGICPFKKSRLCQLFALYDIARRVSKHYDKRIKEY